mmetsp:Transcript_18628/g.60955  ORF Transcript_18628/g.60955 Transcript_18628/m.60955 type:complete len:407 (+) Transcript_18628:119-1339(+)
MGCYWQADRYESPSDYNTSSSRSLSSSKSSNVGVYETPAAWSWSSPRAGARAALAGLGCPGGRCCLVSTSSSGKPSPSSEPSPPPPWSSASSRLLLPAASSRPLGWLAARSEEAVSSGSLPATQGVSVVSALPLKGLALALAPPGLAGDARLMGLRAAARRSDTAWASAAASAACVPALSASAAARPAVRASRRARSLCFFLSSSSLSSSSTAREMRAAACTRPRSRLIWATRSLIFARCSACSCAAACPSSATCPSRLRSWSSASASAAAVSFATASCRTRSTSCISANLRVYSSTSACTSAILAWWLPASFSSVSACPRTLPCRSLSTRTSSRSRTSARPGSSFCGAPSAFCTSFCARASSLPFLAAAASASTRATATADRDSISPSADASLCTCRRSCSCSFA